jgi:hypothetical protein
MLNCTFNTTENFKEYTDDLLASEHFHEKISSQYE